MKNKNNVIIVFANQKGGVGKSTLCLLLASYLVYWKKSACVIDTDLQQSASLQRQIDEQQFDTEPPYAIQSFPISDTATMQQLMENAQEFDGYVLFDAPGNIKDDGLAVMLAYADAIVCPYEYETKSLVSTQTFVDVLEQLRQLNPQMSARLFLVPNKVDTRIGTAADWNAWAEQEAALAQHGVVTPRAGYRIQMRRVNTYDLLDDQKHAVYETLRFIIHTLRTIRNEKQK
jgi:chromosome partitioning protein